MRVHFIVGALMFVVAPQQRWISKFDELLSISLESFKENVFLAALDSRVYVSSAAQHRHWEVHVSVGAEIFPSSLFIHSVEIFKLDWCISKYIKTFIA